MIHVVYILCALASLACAVLLFRGYRRSRARLLLWSMWCFVGLFLNNVLLLVDTHVVPDVDLAIVRLVPALLGACALVYGLVMDAE
ncbi:MAG TPA: DUF5985 family protein [Gemmatimonadaceae bacterium]|nr:DUF5985 family protein [Gemmatimonadaceae bacterium]